jgi:hypothetical protein
MQPRVLSPPEGYDRRAAAACALAAQLDPLLRSLAARVQDASVAELEWQIRPGRNTIGMLLAHLALSEIYWMQGVACDLDSDAAADRVALACLGIRMSDDGLPLAPDGAHPRALAGKTAAEYLDLLWRARRATHAMLRAWDDASLERIHVADGAEVTRAWILFHVVEHFAQHAGQITLLASLRRALSGA